MPNEHYSHFVREAFIEPIRSVLIVDDDYPTFDEMIDAELASMAKVEKAPPVKAWHKEPERIRTVIRSFRKASRPLLVDVHDGANVRTGGDVVVADHLHQSDFLVLDYQLDREKQDDGSRAIEIIRHLAANKHFNLVLLHTNTNIDRVFDEVHLALLPGPAAKRREYGHKKSLAALERAEDKIEGLSDRILSTVGSAQYFEARHNATGYLDAASEGREPFGLFRQTAAEADLDKGDIKFVLEHALGDFERRRAGQMAPPDAQVPERSGGAVKWLRTDTVFVAFRGKGQDGDLLEGMADALCDWRPPPSRLYLAKIRAEMDEHGVAAQDLALGHTHALAHWYDRLLRADERERRSLVSESVARHSEQLMSAILENVVDYAGRLVQAEVGHVDREKLALHHFGVDLSDKATRERAYQEHNAFVCSKPPHGWHLTTGHVFTIDTDHWVCLTPACDTIPQQLSFSKRKSFGNRLPFMAVKLVPRDGTLVTAAEISSNRCIYLRLDGRISSFSFNRNEVSAPNWRIMYAERSGELDKLGFNVLVTKTEDGALVYRSARAQVVSQLRYEYALNLIQKLGVSLTRIGLDFVAESLDDANDA